MLDKHGKTYTEAKDLEELKDARLRNIVKVVYFRKKQNKLTDFIFGLWDS
jgi:hypothetical protein